MPTRESASTAAAVATSSPSAALHSRASSNSLPITAAIATSRCSSSGKRVTWLAITSRTRSGTGRVASVLSAPRDSARTSSSTTNGLPSLRPQICSCVRASTPAASEALTF
jgi:hypothetical protein